MYKVAVHLREIKKAEVALDPARVMGSTAAGVPPAHGYYFSSLLALITDCCRF